MANLMIWFVCIQIGYFSFVNLSNIKFIYILILHYLLHILTVRWLLMKLWQKPHSLLLCIMIRCSLKTELLHKASVGLHQTAIHSSDLPVRTKWNMWICMYSNCDRNLYVFILTIHIFCLFIFVIGRQWLEPSVFWSSSHF